MNSIQKAIYDHDAGGPEPVRRLWNAASWLMNSEQITELSCLSVKPLALLLTQSADLLKLSSGACWPVEMLNADESGGPNLHTRLRCLRDLASGAVFAAEARWRENEAFEDASSVQHVSFTVDWEGLLRRYCNTEADAQVVREVVNVLDDVVEAAVLIAAEFVAPPRLPDWNEVTRHLIHIRDHFDFAEQHVIDILRAAD